ncbi:FtsX-like permease family protein [Candidatus Poribacteria bacterium]|nr:FtsX-like permease family protein [Candidatus Poribacteria bacterium]MBT5532519.1 FtsX-like permease family protein [Candidatus Poribacteria bacterium]MBT7097285.1 FtsX-like permease family protein [Candidatus Poribacteria bacterium]MBT7808725.1 FtsX-like permease family protein [Candidatus Poribacteria bacterium]
MQNQTGSAIRSQIRLPFGEAVRISYQSLKIRFWRSIITTLGILSGIAFLVAVLAGSSIESAVIAEETQTVDTSAEEEAAGIPAHKVWLVAMSLIVCVVGISNAMLMSVTERFREIGTMKCLGALDKFVVLLFLLEACFQGLAGAIAGSLVGTVFALLVNLKAAQWSAWRVFYKFPWFLDANGYLLGVVPVIIGGCLVGMLLAVLGAAGPAFRAAKMPPVDAMRVEV